MCQDKSTSVRLFSKYYKKQYSQTLFSKNSFLSTLDIFICDKTYVIVFKGWVTIGLYGWSFHNWMDVQSFEMAALYLRVQR